MEPEVLHALSTLTAQSPDRFHMPADLWVRTVYAFALGHHRRALNLEHLLRSLTPLYLGRTASWVNQAASFDAAQVEAELNALCERFEALKPDLARLWTEGRTQS
jgi:hypothetical protein